MANLQLPPLALYIHIPWCEKKCPYCDFNSHVTQVIPEAEYVDALIRDALSQLHYVQGREIVSIFIGGGTPSLFSASAIKKVLDKLKRIFQFAADIEITMEANPGSSEQKKFAELYQAGVNRLSLGVQSFQDHQLTKLGRIHNSGEAIKAVKAARDAGFTRINIDLMHGLPDQTTALALEDLQTAIDTGVSHISWYQLTIEQNTEFYRYPPLLPVEDTLADIQDRGFALLEAHGFNQYEVSAFCKEGQQARHNVNYWQFGDYLAIGAGAHGKITLPEKNEIIRFNNTRLPKDYLARTNDFTAQIQTLEHDDVVFEFLMNGLRLTEGVSVESFAAYTGCDESELRERCKSLLEKKLMVIDERIRTTPLGFRYLNTVLEEIL